MSDPIVDRPHCRLSAVLSFGTKASSVGLPPEWASDAPPDAVAVCRAVQSCLGPASQPLAGWLADPASFGRASSLDTNQRWWADRVHQARRTFLERAVQVQDSARLFCQSSPFAHAWLLVMPSRALRTTLPNEDFRLLLRWWLGCHLVVGADSTPCPRCGDFVDAFGDHFVCCRKNGMTERHNALRDCLHGACERAGAPARKEQGCEGGTRDADILLLAWNKGRHTAVDLVFDHALAPSKWPLALSRVKDVLPAAEASKARLASERCARAGWDFQGAAFSLWGRPGPAAASLLYKVQHLSHTGAIAADRETRELEFRQNFSLSLQRSIARQLRLAIRVQDATSTGDGPGVVWP